MTRSTFVPWKKGPGSADPNRVGSMVHAPPAQPAISAIRAATMSRISFTSGFQSTGTWIVFLLTL